MQLKRSPCRRKAVIVATSTPKVPANCCKRTLSPVPVDGRTALDSVAEVEGTFRPCPGRCSTSGRCIPAGPTCRRTSATRRRFLGRSGGGRSGGGCSESWDRLTASHRCRRRGRSGRSGAGASGGTSSTDASTRLQKADMLFGLYPCIRRSMRSRLLNCVRPRGVRSSRETSVLNFWIVPSVSGASARDTARLAAPAPAGVGDGETSAPSRSSGAEAAPSSPTWKVAPACATVTISCGRPPIRRLSGS